MCIAAAIEGSNYLAAAMRSDCGCRSCAKVRAGGCSAEAESRDSVPCVLESLLSDDSFSSLATAAAAEPLRLSEPQLLLYDLWLVCRASGTSWAGGAAGLAPRAALGTCALLGKAARLLWQAGSCAGGLLLCNCFASELAGLLLPAALAAAKFS